MVLPFTTWCYAIYYIALHYKLHYIVLFLPWSCMGCTSTGFVVQQPRTCTSEFNLVADLRNHYHHFAAVPTVVSSLGYMVRANVFAEYPPSVVLIT